MLLDAKFAAVLAVLSLESAWLTRNTGCRCRATTAPRANFRRGLMYKFTDRSPSIVQEFCHLCILRAHKIRLFIVWHKSSKPLEALWFC
jgi:hypothetical protein